MQETAIAQTKGKASHSNFAGAVNSIFINFKSTFNFAQFLFTSVKHLSISMSSRYYPGISQPHYWSYRWRGHQ